MTINALIFFKVNIKWVMIYTRIRRIFDPILLSHKSVSKNFKNPSLLCPWTDPSSIIKIGISREILRSFKSS